MSIREIKQEMRSLAEADRIPDLQRFFKTGKGEYAEGDRFLGIRVPHLRKLSRQYHSLPMVDVTKLLHSPWHEERLLALFIMVLQFNKGMEEPRRAIYQLYLANTASINNWDLVDCSAPHIVGGWLAARSRKPLYKLARSQSLWERRIAMLACFYFIRQGELDDAIKIAEILVEDEHDLIHKAVGWMLREIGKQDEGHMLAFIQSHYQQMPRVMLRYAIEKLPKTKRQDLLSGSF